MDNPDIGQSPEFALAVLAGGRSQRMQGQDKGLALLAGKPLFMHVLARMGQAAAQTVVVTGQHAEAYGQAGFPVIADAGIGPLGGILAAMQAVARQWPFHWLLVVPCDMPFLPEDLRTRLWQAVQASGSELAVPVCEGNRQHAVMLCHLRLAAELEAYLVSGGRSIHGWLDQLAPAYVDFGDCAPFANLNTPEELMAADGVIKHPDGKHE